MSETGLKLEEELAVQLDHWTYFHRYFGYRHTEIDF